ncbi:SIS domain-containing protein [Cellulomonas fengjieae]|uniref:SIS domain-containing protein n=1 Tax=Cellulomonas fengjieae TaxID=2819978 RepID=A0ABS3SHK5_9CELL|nr:SIS domain-containing protein [Cellulomonas fengjieae]MBO3085226.1 SIS domain-containing protein [Cellulomonas fengjieae]QVI66208.1 SIS domain-containing protein [Cellulomonas fengjieae]
MTTHTGAVLDSCRTGAEIAQQPDVWREVAALVAGQRDALDRFVTDALTDPRTEIVLTGAGTSSYIGELVASEVARHTGRTATAVPTTDVVASPATALPADRPVLLVSFARSGDSPESVAAVELADQVIPGTRHLVITCNAAGALGQRCADRADAYVLTLPEASNDAGFAMTSSFTGMALATLLAFGSGTDVAALATAAEAVRAVAEEAAAAVLALRPRRLVHLGSGALKGLAHESALKCLELTAGRVLALADTPMAFRHGPKSALDGTTVAVVYLSNDPYTRQYDVDLARELSTTLGAERVVVVDATGDADVPATTWSVPGVAGLPDAEWALPAVLFAQVLALAASLAEGLTPDNPFPGGEVNRVVQGVVIHPYTGPKGQ